MASRSSLAITAIFPEDTPMWRAAEALMRRRVPGDQIDVSFAPNRGGARLADADIIVAFALHESEARRARRLRWIQSLGSGTDGLTAAAAVNGAVLTSARGLHAAPVSEAVVAAMLGLARGMAASVRDQDAALWRPRPASLLAGRAVGIVGTGEIASAFARKCAAFDMVVTGFSASPRPLAFFERVLPRGDLTAAAPALDHIALLTPLDETTRHIGGTALLEAMKIGAFLLNFGRGGLVDHAALLSALDAERIGGAALDAFDTEPLPPTDPLWSRSSVLLTPHSAGRHTGYVADVIGLFVDNLSAWRCGATGELRNHIV